MKLKRIDYSDLMKNRIRIILIILALSIGVFGAVSGLFAEQSSREYKLKAGLIYNIAKFVEFPPPPSGKGSPQFIIGILGEDPFGPEINILSKKTVQNKQICIERYANVTDINNCSILFISESKKAQLGSILERLEEACILTLSDMESFAQNGGMIQFVTINNRIGFKVNLRSAEAVNLKLSAHFLKLTSIVDQ